MVNKSGSMIRTMLSIAIPVTLQNLLFSSFTLVDTLMIGQLGDTPLAAVGMAGKWSWFLSVVFSAAPAAQACSWRSISARGISRAYAAHTA